jgi:type II secretory pathway pseudopilin PulG
MSAARWRQALRSDEGFTLAELAVATVVLTIVLVAVGGLMFSTTVTQRTVSAVSLASSSGQTAADVIQSRVRNAVELRPLATLDGADQLLVARVAGTGSSANFTCVGWYYAADEGELRTSTWPTAGSTALPTNADGVAEWSLLASGVAPTTGNAGVFHSATTSSVGVAFEVASNADNEPTRIQFTAALAADPEGGTTCWD